MHLRIGFETTDGAWPAERTERFSTDGFAAMLSELNTLARSSVGLTDAGRLSAWELGGEVERTGAGRRGIVVVCRLAAAVLIYLDVSRLVKETLIERVMSDEGTVGTHPLGMSGDALQCPRGCGSDTFGECRSCRGRL